MSQQNTRPTAHQHAQSFSDPSRITVAEGKEERENLSLQGPLDSLRPGVIEEVSEPASPDAWTASQKSSSASSMLSELLRKPPRPKRDEGDQDDDASFDSKGMQPAIVGRGIISQPSACTTHLLAKTAYASGQTRGYGALQDIESQKAPWESPSVKLQCFFTQIRNEGARIGRFITTPKSWDKRGLWVYAVREPASCAPPVILGLLLNILDALSYGEWLFSVARIWLPNTSQE